MQFSPIICLKVSLFVICTVFTGCYVSYDNSSNFKTETHGIVLKELPTLPEAIKPFDYPFSDDNDHRDCKFDDMMF
jgi:hypothetical protein